MAQNKVGTCNVFRVSESEWHNYYLLKLNYAIRDKLKKYSVFCKDKTIGNCEFINKGSFGEVYSVILDGIEYAVKIQKVSERNELNKMEKEVNISNTLSELRRKDGQRICVPIFDCFFICYMYDNGICRGEMLYIMEKGIDSIQNIMVSFVSPFHKIDVKIILYRDVMFKMMENIDILISETGIVNYDIKPGNSIFNYKSMIDTGLVQLNPIFIDFDENFCELDFNNLINKDALNYILCNYIEEGEPIFDRILNEDDLKQIFSFILKLSYLNQSIRLIDLSFKQTNTEPNNAQDSPNDVNLKKLIAYVFFNKDTTMTPLNIIINTIPENRWLVASVQILLKTKLLDTSKSEHFRKQFYHYNVSQREEGLDTLDKLYTNIIHFIEWSYINSKAYFGEFIGRNTLELDFTEVDRLYDQGKGNRWNYPQNENGSQNENGYHIITTTNMPTDNELNRQQKMSKTFLQKMSKKFLQRLFRK